MIVLELEQTLMCLESIRQTSSILDKKSLLKKHDSPVLRRALELAYNDHKYGFGPEARQELYARSMAAPYEPEYWWHEVLTHVGGCTGLMSILQKELVEHLVATSPNGHYGSLLIGILTKDLRLGLRAKSILEVFPNLFEVFNVQLAKPFNIGKVRLPCAVEPKFDGIRAVYIGGRYLSRYGQELHGPEIDCPAGWVLDGELVAGHFQETLSRVRLGGEMLYYVFDTIPQEEWDSKEFKLTNLQRNEACPRDIKGIEGVTRVWVLNQQSIEIAHARNLSLGFEGSMIKANVPYELKRSYSWMKIKPTLDMDVRVQGISKGEGKYEGMIGALVCTTPDGMLFNLGSGFSDEDRATWKGIDVIGQVCELTYQELTLDGIPRFARFKRWRPDKGGQP